MSQQYCHWKWYNKTFMIKNGIKYYSQWFPGREIPLQTLYDRIICFELIYKWWWLSCNLSCIDCAPKIHRFYQVTSQSNNGNMQDWAWLETPHLTEHKLMNMYFPRWKLYITVTSWVIANAQVFFYPVLVERVGNVSQGEYKKNKCIFHGIFFKLLCW